MYHSIILFSFGFTYASIQYDDQESRRLFDYVSHRVARSELPSKTTIQCYQNNGADINKFFLINGTSRNCLHFSAEMLTSTNNTEYIERAIRRLVKHGANVNIKDGNNHSLFQKIIRPGLINDQIVRVLIEYGANVNDRCTIKTVTNITPLMLYTLCINPMNNQRDLRAIKVLLDNGADRHARDSNYDTAAGYLVHTILNLERPLTSSMSHHYIDYFKECIDLLMYEEPASIIKNK